MILTHFKHISIYEIWFVIGIVILSILFELFKVIIELVSVLKSKNKSKIVPKKKRTPQYEKLSLETRFATRNKHAKSIQEQLGKRKYKLRLKNETKKERKQNQDKNTSKKVQKSSKDTKITINPPHKKMKNQFINIKSPLFSSRSRPSPDATPKNGSSLIRTGKVNIPVMNRRHHKSAFSHILNNKLDSSGLSPEEKSPIYHKINNPNIEKNLLERLAPITFKLKKRPKEAVKFKLKEYKRSKII